MKLAVFMIFSTLGLAWVSSSLAQAPPPLLQPVSVSGLKVTTDTGGFSHLQPWADRAREMVVLWYPVVAAYLDTPDARLPREIKIEFKDMPGVAHTAAGVITIAKAWVEAHPEDLGMVLHEMTHAVQAYPPSKDGWLVEGIADYIRFWMAEPAGQPKSIGIKDHYRKGYRVAGAFLAWIEQRHAPLIIREASAALRRGTYDDKLFLEKTGKDLDTLWAEFVEERRTTK
jgi:hypothetical protein